MTQTQLLKRIQRANWRSLQRLVRQAYQEGFNAGLARATEPDAVAAPSAPTRGSKGWCAASSATSAWDATPSRCASCMRRRAGGFRPAISW